MLFKADVLKGIAAGKVTLAFRRWVRPAVREGQTLTTAAGVLAFDKVDRVNVSAITSRDAAKAGFGNRDVLIETLGEGDSPVYKITFHRVGDDPRLALRNDPDLENGVHEHIRAQLSRMDVRSERPWVMRTLALIGSCPGRRATELAGQLGMEKDRLN